VLFPVWLTYAHYVHFGCHLCQNYLRLSRFGLFKSTNSLPEM
jgi:hypothetical protein